MEIASSQAAALEEAPQPDSVQPALTTEPDPDLGFILLGNKINGEPNGKINGTTSSKVNGNVNGKINRKVEVEVEHELQPRVLLVAPDNEARQSLRRRLEESEIDVVAAKIMEEALAYARLRSAATDYLRDEARWCPLRLGARAQNPRHARARRHPNRPSRRRFRRTATRPGLTASPTSVCVAPSSRKSSSTVPNSYWKVKTLPASSAATSASSRIPTSCKC